MSANTFQRQLMARRLLWIMVGPKVLQRLKFPWHKLASRPLPKGWLGTVRPPEPVPQPEPMIPTPEPEPGPAKPQPPEPPQIIDPWYGPELEPEQPEPEPKPEPYEPEPEPELEPDEPEPEPEPEPDEPEPEPEPEPDEPEPEPEPEPDEPEPEPEPKPIEPTPKPKPEEPDPYIPPPIYIPPWVPGPPRRPSPGHVALKDYTVYARSDDGYIYRGWRDWPDVRNNANGDALWYQGTSSSSGMATRRQAADSYRIYRSFFSFDLSGLPSRRIRSAVLRLYCTAPTTNNISIQEGTQNIPIVLSDYSGFTGTYFVAQAYRAGLNYLTFNDTGLAYLRSSLGSVAKLCGREYSHDYLGSQPLSDVAYLNPVAYSEWGLSAQRPLLTIVL